VTVQILDDYQRLDPEVHVHAADHEPARRAADLDRVPLDRPRETRGPGQSLRGCCTLCPTSAPAVTAAVNGHGGVHAVRFAFRVRCLSPAVSLAIATLVGTFVTPG
jgi:hypothetical protein